MDEKDSNKQFNLPLTKSSLFTTGANESRTRFTLSLVTTHTFKSVGTKKASPPFLFP